MSPEINDWKEVPVNDWQEVKLGSSAQQEPGFLSRVGTDLSNRASGAWNALTESSPDPNYPTRFPERLLRAGGQVAGGVLDIPTEAVKSAYRTLVPEESRQVFSDFVKPGIEAISPAIQYLTQKAKDYPNLTKDAEALMNIAGAVPLVKGTTSLVKGTIPYAKDIASIGKESVLGATDTPALTKKIVEVGVRKGIKPTNLGRNPKVTQGFYDDVSMATQDIVKNKGLIELNGEKGRVPVNLAETLDALEQNKKISLERFLGAQQEAGQGGAIVKPQGLVDELVKMAESDKGQAGAISEYARKQLPLYAEQTESGNWLAKAFTPQEAQADVAQLNRILNGFFKNPTYESLSQTGVKLTLRDQMASALNDAVESMVGPGHQEFKNTWGALKNMEGQVVHRFNVDARKASSGFFDLTTPFTAAKVIAGLAGKDPISLAGAAGMWGAKKYLKAMNEPNRYIKGMFDGLDNINNQGLRNTQFFADRSLWSPPPEPQGLPMPNTPYSMESPFQWKSPQEMRGTIEMPNQLSGLLTEGEFNGLPKPPIPLLREQFTPGISAPPQGVVGPPSISGTPPPPGGQHPANFVQGGIQPTTTYAPGARRADQTVYLPKYTPQVEATPMPLLTSQNRPLSTILTQIPNRPKTFDNKIDWMNSTGGK
jgi:hypothetical protein